MPSSRSNCRLLNAVRRVQFRLITQRERERRKRTYSDPLCEASHTSYTSQLTWIYVLLFSNSLQRVAKPSYISILRTYHRAQPLHHADDAGILLGVIHVVWERYGDRRDERRVETHEMILVNPPKKTYECALSQNMRACLLTCEPRSSTQATIYTKAIHYCT